MFDANGLLKDGVKQGDFSSAYTNWLTYVFNDDAVQTWLASQDASYNAWQLSRSTGTNVTTNGGFAVELNQNSTSLLPTFSYSNGGATRTIDQSLVAQIFGAKDDVTIQTGSKATQTQERSYVYSFDNIENKVPTAAQEVDEDQPLLFSGTKQIQISDGDSANITVSLSVGAYGNLSVDLADLSNVTVTAGENGSSALTLSGSKAGINAALLTLQYKGDQDWFGKDALTITTNDGLFSDTDTVAITVKPVNDAPVAQAGTAAGDEDTIITGSVQATDVDSTSLTYSVVSGPAEDKGTLKFNSDGSYTFTPAKDFFGEVTFTYKASDGSAVSNVETVKITVNPINDAPVAVDIQDQSSDEDQPVSFTVPAFTDVDNASLTYSATLENGDPLPSWLSFDAASRTFSGTPPQDFNGAIVLKVTGSDGSLSAFDTFTLTINPVNDAPVAQAGMAAGDEDTPILGSVAATDVDGDKLAYSLAHDGAPKNGTVTVHDDGSYSYQGNKDFNGTDSFKVLVDDGHGGTVSSTVSVTIKPVNDAPKMGAISGHTINDTAATPPTETFANLTGSFSASDVDNATGTLTYSIDGGVYNATAGTWTKSSPYGDLTVTESSGTYTFVANANAVNGLSSGKSELVEFNVVVKDPASLSDTGKLAITINGADEVVRVQKTMDFDTGVFSGGNNHYIEDGLRMTREHGSQDLTSAIANWSTADQDKEVKLTKVLQQNGNTLSDAFNFSKDGGGKVVFVSVEVLNGTGDWYGYIDNGTGGWTQVAHDEVTTTGTHTFNASEWSGLDRVEWVAKTTSGQVIDNLFWI